MVFAEHYSSHLVFSRVRLRCACPTVHPAPFITCAVRVRAIPEQSWRTGFLYGNGRIVRRIVPKMVGKILYGNEVIPSMNITKIMNLFNRPKYSLYCRLRFLYTVTSDFCVMEEHISRTSQLCTWTDGKYGTVMIIAERIS